MKLLFIIQAALARSLVVTQTWLMTPILRLLRVRANCALAAARTNEARSWYHMEKPSHAHSLTATITC
jgi:hypothetical protein